MHKMCALVRRVLTNSPLILAQGAPEVWQRTALLLRFAALNPSGTLV